MLCPGPRQVNNGTDLPRTLGSRGAVKVRIGAGWARKPDTEAGQAGYTRKGLLSREGRKMHQGFDANDNPGTNDDHSNDDEDNDRICQYRAETRQEDRR